MVLINRIKVMVTDIYGKQAKIGRLPLRYDFGRHQLKPGVERSFRVGDRLLQMVAHGQELTLD